MAQPKKYPDLKKQRGMTLLEIIIVLGIIGTIAAGVVVLAQRAFDSKALTDLISNTNTVRIAMKDAYGPTGIYPAASGNDALTLNDTNLQTDGANSPIGKLVLLGKLSVSEAKNNISNNFFNVGGADLGPVAAVANHNKAYFIEINGLSQTQCRNILTQVGNDFDYVEVLNGGDPSGTYTAPEHIDITAATVPPDGTTGLLPDHGVFRSLATDGSRVITPDQAVGACQDSSSNGIILGSR